MKGLTKSFACAGGLLGNLLVVGGVLFRPSLRNVRSVIKEVGSLHNVRSVIKEVGSLRIVRSVIK